MEKFEFCRVIGQPYVGAKRTVTMQKLWAWIARISKTEGNDTDTTSTAAYVSITPRSLSTNPSNPQIFMNGTFGKNIGLKHEDLVTILVSETNVPPITRAFVLPISSDDWEILEPNSSHITNSLLNQIRVVYEGLCFPFWITKTMVVLLKVEKVEPSSADVGCGILYNSTEIIVAPVLQHSGLQFNTQNQLFSDFENFRIHTPQFEEEHESTIAPNLKLLLENVHNGFMYCNGNEKVSSNNFLAKIYPSTGAEPIILKISALESLEINSNLLKRCFPKNPWPCLYVHNSIISEKLPCKTWITLENICGMGTNAMKLMEYKPLEISKPSASNRERSFKGFDSLISLCSSFIKTSLSINGLRYKNLLLTGKEGSGKTTIATRIAENFEGFPYFLHVEKIKLVLWIGKKPETVENLFKAILLRCVKVSPFILILDDLDALLSPSGLGEEDAQQKFLRQRIADVILDSLQKICDKEHIRYFILATCTTSIDAKLLGNYFFLKMLSIPPPTTNERIGIFSHYFEMGEATNSKEINIKQIQIQSLHDENATPLILTTMAQAWNDTNKDQDFKTFMSTILKRVAEENESHTTSIHTRWDQIGGLEEAKDSIIRLIQWPLMYPKLFDKVPFSLPSSILLYGYPGSGKTMLALGLRDLVPNLKFIHIKGPQLLSKYIGSSEENVKKVFERARNSKPCILFFDEFDSLVPRRGHDSTGVTDRVVNQFLTEMDGITGGLGPGVYLVGATSRPDLIDPAILRAGRMEKHLFVPMPSREDRLQILQKLLQKLDLHFEDGTTEFSLAQIADRTENFTGADLESILNSSQLIVIQEFLSKLGYNETIELGMNDHNFTEEERMAQRNQIVINMSHIEEILANYKPSIFGSEFDRFSKIFKVFHNSREFNMNSGTGFVGTRATLA